MWITGPQILAHDLAQAECTTYQEIINLYMRFTQNLKNVFQLEPVVLA